VAWLWLVKPQQRVPDVPQECLMHFVPRSALSSVAPLASILALFVLVLAAPKVAIGAAEGIDRFDAYRGLYRAGPDHIVGIDAFINDDGTPTMLFSDYQSGIVRRLFPGSDGEFVMGPNFNQPAPVELTVTFPRNESDAVASIVLHPIGASQSTAARIPLAREDVVFRNGDAKLSGTLIVPASDGPRPAIVLLHGSGPLTRYSFGPYPQFFASLGFAVLIYDKRGTGASSGTRVDASTGRAMAPQYYPEDLVNDALAAFRLLRERPDIDPERIGFWGSSEGGMLATQVAARSSDVMFAIDSSGFMGPLWQTTLYQAAAIPRKYGATEADIREYVAFTQQWLDVARTGRGWDAFVARREQMRRKNENVLFWSSGEFQSVQEMRWYWDHVLSFNPLPALKNVRCPVLGIFGESDTSTEAPVAANNLQRVLTEAGNDDVTVQIVPGAGHSLSTASGDRMAPGVFDTLRSWLLARAGSDRHATRGAPHRGAPSSVP
jgi:pimeloyl-ACP methyl ester carboxylesterase